MSVRKTAGLKEGLPLGDYIPGLMTTEVKDKKFGLPLVDRAALRRPGTDPVGLQREDAD